jgi:hypothetical protein
VRLLILVTGARLLGAPAAFAHEGSPNFLSQVNSVTPAVAGVTVTVLNRDDRLLLQADRGHSVVVEGYSEEPYARIDADGTVSVNTDSQAYYLNQERDGQVEPPDGVDSKGEPAWKEVSRTGRFEWHDHRMHWMSDGDPEQVKDKDVRTKVFDWKVPVEIDGRSGDIAGTLFWTPVPGSDVPVALIIALAAVAIAICVAITVARRRRRPAAEAW